MYEAQINSGIAWLNARYFDWQDEIDLDRLDLSCCLDCVMGQLENNYWTIEPSFPGDTEEERERWAIAHGFTLEIPASSRQWKQLTREWRTAIAALQEEME